MSEKALINIEEEMKSAVANIGSQIASPQGHIIRVKNKKFISPDGQESDEIKVVVLDFVTTQSYWEGIYDPNTYDPPICFAVGRNPNQLVPTENSIEKQAEDCSTCPNFQWGSAGKGKACKTNRLLAVVAPSDPGKTEMLMLRVSPTGIKNWDRYVNEIRKEYNVLPTAVVTRVVCLPDLSYACLDFELVSTLSDDHVRAAWSRRGKAAEMLEQEPDFASFMENKAKTVSAKNKSAIRSRK